VWNVTEWKSAASICALQRLREKPDGRSALAPWDERLSTSQIEAVMLKSTE
jgi:hypothetical protein